MTTASQNEEVMCAFCGGNGHDPFGIMSPLSTCQVCGGAGRRTLPGPTTPCVFCKGTGVHPSLRLTCTTCMGIGRVHMPADAASCPECGGTGRASTQHWPDSPFACTHCGGKGVVPPPCEDRGLPLEPSRSKRRAENRR